MKLAIVIFALVACAVAAPPSPDIEEYKKKAQANIKACITESETTEETATNLKNGVFNANDDQKAKCFVNCFFQKTGFLNAQGEPQEDIILTKLANKPEVKDITNDALKTLIHKCVQETGKDGCERSYNIYKCYRAGIA